MNKILIYFLFLFLITATIPAIAQENSKQEKKSQFKMGLYYNSNLNYYGRTDSLRSSGIFPMAEIWFTKELYISGAPVFVHNETEKFNYAGTIATLGYLGKSKSEKFLSHIYITKPIYKENSNLVQSALKAQGNGNFTFLNKIINLSVGGDIKISDKTDYGFNGGVDHLFRVDLPGEVVLVFDPSAYVYAGTQQFTKTYYKKSNFLFFPGIDQQVSEEVSKLNILSYELSAPVIIAKNNLQFSINPSYVIPQNLVTVENRPELSERGKDMFYFTAGVKVTF
ncbi:MAG TPA: hypothetical protein VI548_00105 [Chitinophagaceae bacterium]|nr:hypothetical protein [Chitinophagaceae bacterium]